VALGDRGWRLACLKPPVGPVIMILSNLPADHLDALERCKIYR